MVQHRVPAISGRKARLHFWSFPRKGIYEEQTRSGLGAVLSSRPMNGGGPPNGVSMEHELAIVAKEVTAKLDEHTALFREQGRDIRELGRDVREQGWDMREVKARLAMVDTRLNGLDERLDWLREEMREKFEAQDKKLEQILLLLTTFTTKPGQEN